MQLHKLLLLFTIFLIISPATVLGDQNWKYFKKEEGIAVYCREIQGHSEKEFKATMIVNQPLEVVGSVLMDISLYCQWIDGCQSAKIIDPLNAAEDTVYLSLKIPWPFYDRDVFYKIKSYIESEAGKIVVAGVAVKNHPIQPVGKCVRINDAKYHATLVRIAPDRTRIIYKSLTDMAGSICAFESNLLSGNFIYNSMTKLKKLLLQKQYVKYRKQSLRKKPQSRDSLPNRSPG